MLSRDSKYPTEPGVERWRHAEWMSQRCALSQGAAWSNARLQQRASFTPLAPDIPQLPKAGKRRPARRKRIPPPSTHVGTESPETRPSPPRL